MDQRDELPAEEGRLLLQPSPKPPIAQPAPVPSDLSSVIAALKQSELRYRSLIEATVAIVWNTPASGEFETEQPGWAEFTGQTFDELKGWGWLNAIHPEDRPHTACVWSAAVASRTLYQVEHRIRRSDGEYRHMMVRAVPILAEDGTITEWIGVHTDVSAQMRAKEAAEAATRAKSEFLANMSHEIRTPMNGVLGMTELALDTELTSQQRDYLTLVKSSAEALLTIINDILDFSKIEAGKLEIDPVPFALRDCVEGLLKPLALRAHAKNLELSVRVAPDIPDALVGDSGRLQQILVNLVGNAIKFTEQGEVVVSVSQLPPVNAPSNLQSEICNLQFSVKDTGIGIPPNKLQAILEPFTQADSSTTRKYGGTGLGLSIGRKLAELMEGRLWVESEPGRGSTFHFTVRLGVQTGAPAQRRAVDFERLRGLPILIVDDNRTNRRILEEVLTNWGASPVSVDGGAAALDALRSAHETGRAFPIVLLDAMMPEMDGYMVAERIAADPTLRVTRVVLLSSSEMAGDQARREALKIPASLLKPIRQSELLDLLMRLLSSRPGHAVPPRTVSPDGTATGRPPRHLKILLAEDHVVNQRVVTTMLEKRGHTVTIAGDGCKALELWRRMPFDLVLMDVQMPELDGFEAVAAIRKAERETGRHTPVLALTAHAMKGDKERCLEGGFDGYLSKPVRSDQLFALVDDLVTRSGDRSDVSGGPTVVRASDREVFDRRVALQCTAGDEALLNELLGLFLDDCPRRLDEIRSAIRASDGKALRRAGHTISGAASNFAAPEVMAAARRLETAGAAAAFGECEEHLATLLSALDRFFAALEVADRPIPPWRDQPGPTFFRPDRRA
jgi:PAS domain S-box-containing protein